MPLIEIDGKLHHKTKDNQVIPLDKLADRHLVNILKRHHRLAESGLEVISGSYDWMGGTDHYVDVEVYHGEEALAKLRHADYVKEAKRRGLNFGCECLLPSRAERMELALRNLAEEWLPDKKTSHGWGGCDIYHEAEKLARGQKPTIEHKVEALIRVLSGEVSVASGCKEWGGA